MEYQLPELTEVSDFKFIQKSSKYIRMYFNQSITPIENKNIFLFITIFIDKHPSTPQATLTPIKIDHELDLSQAEYKMLTIDITDHYLISLN